MARPDLKNVPPFYHGYIMQVQQEDAVPAVELHAQQTSSFLETIPESKWMHAYDKGKWTIKELVQHLIDAERVFAYRALRFSRKDLTPLPGFDENLFTANSAANRRSPQDILQEMKLVSQSSLHLFKSFNEEQLQSTGIANGSSVSVEAIGFILAGHALHHVRILKERYL